MKNAFDGLMSRLDVAEERISEFEDMSSKSSTSEKQREKGIAKAMNRISENYRATTKRCTIWIMGMSEVKGRKKQKKYLEQ